MNKQSIQKKAKLTAIRADVVAIAANAGVVNDVIQETETNQSIADKSAQIAKLSNELAVELSQFIKEIN